MINDSSDTFHFRPNLPQQQLRPNNFRPNHIRPQQHQLRFRQQLPQINQHQLPPPHQQRLPQLLPQQQQALLQQAQLPMQQALPHQLPRQQIHLQRPPPGLPHQQRMGQPQLPLQQPQLRQQQPGGPQQLQQPGQPQLQQPRLGQPLNAVQRQVLQRLPDPNSVDQQRPPFTPNQQLNPDGTPRMVVRQQLNNPQQQLQVQANIVFIL